MKILIIGNGFDLAHDLPTSYPDFLDFVKAWITGSAGSCFADEINEHVNTNSRLLLYFLEIYKNRCEAGKRGWIDFENEITLIVRALDEARKLVLEHRYDRQQITLSPSISHIVKEVLLVKKDGIGKGELFPDGFEEGKVNELLDGLNRLTRLLEIYLCENVEKRDVSKRLPEITGQNFTHILSFNYTDTYKRLYDPEGKAQYCYIHGEVKEQSNLEDCNLVLGINEYLGERERESENPFVWFKKFYQRIYKATGSEYIDWLENFEEFIQRTGGKGYKDKIEVFIYGHSLDVTDKDVLSRFILEDKTTTYIYYLDKKDLAKKIENLEKVIGQEELIHRTDGKKRTIHFLKIGTVPEEDEEKKKIREALE